MFPIELKMGESETRNCRFPAWSMKWGASRYENQLFHPTDVFLVKRGFNLVIDPSICKVRVIQVPTIGFQGKGIARVDHRRIAFSAYCHRRRPNDFLASACCARGVVLLQITGFIRRECRRPLYLCKWRGTWAEFYRAHVLHFSVSLLHSVTASRESVGTDHTSPKDQQNCRSY